MTISYNGETTSYRYSLFGDAGYWMTENLATSYLPDGSQLTKYTANSTTIPQYAIPGNKASIEGKQGLLYNWPAAMNMNMCIAQFDQGQAQGTTPGAKEVETLTKTIQGICPLGWYVPSYREWNQLEKEMMTNMSKYTQTPLSNSTWNANWESGTTVPGWGWRGIESNGHGKAMVAKSSTIGTTTGDSKTATQGGFDALMAGFVGDGNTAGSYGGATYIWSASSGNDGSYGWYRNLTYQNSKVYRFATNRYYLFSVRCKKD